MTRLMRVFRFALQRLSDLGHILPLEELFLEGPVQPDDFAVLLTAIARLPYLRRLALYQTRNPKPSLFEDLARAAPGLNALTIVAGDCQSGTEWPMPLVRYPVSLSRHGEQADGRLSPLARMPISRSSRASARSASSPSTGARRPRSITRGNRSRRGSRGSNTTRSVSWFARARPCKRRWRSFRTSRKGEGPLVLSVRVCEPARLTLRGVFIAARLATLRGSSGRRVGGGSMSSSRRSTCALFVAL